MLVNDEIYNSINLYRISDYIRGIYFKISLISLLIMSLIIYFSFLGPISNTQDSFSDFYQYL